VPSELPLEAAARRFHEYQTDAPIDRLAGLIHDDAQMTLFVNRLRPLSGKPAILSAIGRGRDALLYSARVFRCHLVDERAVAVYGQARYCPDDRSSTIRDVFWLDEFRDGLLWRVDGFISERELLDAVARRRGEPSADTAFEHVSGAAT